MTTLSSINPHQYWHYLPSDQRVAHIEAVEHILKLAEVNQMSVSSWDIEKFLDDNGNLITDRRKLNHRLMDLIAQGYTGAEPHSFAPSLEYPSVSELVTSLDSDTFEELNKHQLTRWVTEIRRQYMRVKRDLQNECEKVAQLSGELRQYQDRVDRITGHEIDIRSMVNDVVAAGSWEFLGATDDGLWFETCNQSITVQFAGVEYYLGGYRVYVSLEDFACTVYGTNSVDDYINPFVSPSGYPCWGDASHEVAQAKAAGNLPLLLQYLYTLLTTYTRHAGPYHGLSNWPVVSSTKED